MNLPTQQLHLKQLQFQMIILGEFVKPHLENQNIKSNILQ